MVERVGRCCRILSRIFPNWYGRVNTKVLDLQNPINCILGQVFGNYELGLDIFRNNGYDDSTPWRYGLSLKFDECKSSNWEELHDEWVIAISELQRRKRDKHDVE